MASSVKDMLAGRADITNETRVTVLYMLTRDEKPAICGAFS